MHRWMIRATIGTATLLAAAVTLTVGAGFLCFALYASLAAATSPVKAALGTGAALLVVAIVIFIAGRLISGALRRRQRRDNRRSGGSTGHTENKLAADLGAVIGEELISLLRANPRSATVASLLAGFAIGAFPQARRAIHDLFCAYRDGK